jgi:hypothetical protein
MIHVTRLAIAASIAAVVVLGIAPPAAAQTTLHHHQGPAAHRMTRPRSPGAADHHGAERVSGQRAATTAAMTSPGASSQATGVLWD